MLFGCCLTDVIRCLFSLFCVDVLSFALVVPPVLFHYFSFLFFSLFSYSPFPPFFGLWFVVCCLLLGARYLLFGWLLLVEAYCPFVV